MKQLGMFATLTAVIAALGFTVLSPGTADAGDACVRKEFKTELVKQACKAGGADKAKEVMKAWNKEKAVKSCNQCHTKLAPSYELKPDGLAQFKKLGGK